MKRYIDGLGDVMKDQQRFYSLPKEIQKAVYGYLNLHRKKKRLEKKKKELIEIFNKEKKELEKEIKSINDDIDILRYKILNYENINSIKIEDDELPLIQSLYYKFKYIIIVDNLNGDIEKYFPESFKHNKIKIRFTGKYVEKNKKVYIKEQYESISNNIF